jgi:hypothetical protein
MKRIARNALALAVSALWSASTHAMVGCGPGDVTLGVNALGTPGPATSCFAGRGNRLDLDWLNEPDSPVFDATHPWATAAKDEAQAGDPGESFTLSGMRFSVSGATGDSSGAWSLSWTPVTGDAGRLLDLVVVLKASNTWYGYFFENQALDASGSRNGTWQVSFLDRRGRIPDLAYLAVLGRNADGGVPPAVVPLPPSVLLLGSALAAAGLLRRRHLA